MKELTNEEIEAAALASAQNMGSPDTSGSYEIVGDRVFFKDKNNYVSLIMALEQFVAFIKDSGNEE
jgi:hypothetical protein